MTHLESIQALIDAIIDLEEFYPNGLPHEFRAAINRARSEESKIDNQDQTKLTRNSGAFAEW